MKNNDTFDILKYILSFMIIAIHTGGGGMRGRYIRGYELQYRYFL